MDYEIKAKELVEKYLGYMPSVNEYYHEYEPDFDGAKQCALIAVELKLTPLKTQSGTNWTTHVMSHTEIVYWNNVRKATEAL